MGCDIHLYVEYSERGRETPYWACVGGRINPGRDYEVFATLAGVRSDGKVAPIAADRGLPSPHSADVLWENQLYVTDNEELANSEEWCSTSAAERWVASGSSQWLRDDHSAVSHPDHHSHSWCTLAEFRSAIEPKRPRRWGPVGPEWFAILAMAEELERRDCDARFVFWFDN